MAGEYSVGTDPFSGECRYYFILCMCVCLREFVFLIHAGTGVGLKRASDLPKLELKMVVSHHASSRRRTQGL